MNKLKFNLVKITAVSVIAIVAIQLSSCRKVRLDKELTRNFCIPSTKSGAIYEIDVALPENYDPNGHYSTIYVLDAKRDFGYVANKCRDISGQKSIPNAIVIGIRYGNDRSVDYTPTKVKEGGGGAFRFMEFIKDELIPKIEADFAADTSRSKRVILGHSFGGLLCAYAFTSHNEVFGNYIMLSPSLWYDNEVVLKYEQASSEEAKNKEQLVFMGIGASENEDRMLAPFERFYQQLAENHPNMKLAKNVEKGRGHMGSKDPNIEKGLEFFFSK